MIDAALLTAIEPRLAPAIADATAGALEAACVEYSIDTPARRAAFLAQVAHESGGFKWLHEIWGPTPAQAGYEGRADLGNTEQGDGFRYRGRGYLQTTGRANYRKAGAALGLDLEGDPDQLATPGPAARSAGFYWKSHGLNTLADAGLFREITRRVNGGYNGLASREAYWERAQLALGLEPEPPLVEAPDTQC